MNVGMIGYCITVLIYLYKYMNELPYDLKLGSVLAIGVDTLKKERHGTIHHFYRYQQGIHNR